jgi:hypothetical protein
VIENIRSKNVNMKFNRELILNPKRSIPQIISKNNMMLLTVSPSKKISKHTPKKNRSIRG